MMGAMTAGDRVRIRGLVPGAAALDGAVLSCVGGLAVVSLDPARAVVLQRQGGSWYRCDRSGRRAVTVEVLQRQPGEGELCA